MQPADVSAVPADVVEEVLADPASFLAAAASRSPGWATRYGGAEGVAQLSSALHAHLADLTQRNASLRAVAVAYLCSDRNRQKMSLLAVARSLGVTKGAVQHLVRRAEEDPTRLGEFARLASPRAWRSQGLSRTKT